MGVFMCLLNTGDEWIIQAMGLLIAQRRKSCQKNKKFTQPSYLPGLPDQGFFGAFKAYAP